MINQIIRSHRLTSHLTNNSHEQLNASELLRGEWLLTNGLGGYAANSIGGMTTRKYHGYLVAALPPPHGRTIMLNYLSESITLSNGKHYILSCEERQTGLSFLNTMPYLEQFYLNHGLPIWRYNLDGIIIEKKIHLLYRQNTVQIIYRLITGTEKVTLRLKPFLHFRGHEAPVNQEMVQPYKFIATNNQYEISTANYPPLRILIEGGASCFVLQSNIEEEMYFSMEDSRGYEATGSLWTPGHCTVDLINDNEIAFIASTEKWATINAFSPKEALDAERIRRQHLLTLAPQVAQTQFGAELVLAADKFIITPESRIKDAIRAHIEGEEVRTIIAGYHWFTDWGRDTMISLEGLTLCTGRAREGLWILKTFVHYVRDGLIPNMFPEGLNAGLYHTADATLWFFQALNRYLTVTNDQGELLHFLPTMHDIINHHIQGTKFGIGMDPEDGLLLQGAEGYQLTWMDAKVGDWVVTPRRGKAVEINALWYNALRLMEQWTVEQDKRSQYSHLAQQVYQSFNEKFWFDQGHYLYDVIDCKRYGGSLDKDAALRPNQLFSLSLTYTVLAEERWKSVVDICQLELLTPLGLRTLSSNHPDYKSYYQGDLQSRDAAYHQGTVWAWLIGPFIDAWLKVYPDQQAQAREFLLHFEQHLEDSAVGSISEIFDAVPPFTPKGCVAQAWSVAEVLRSWIKTSGENYYISD